MPTSDGARALAKKLKDLRTTEWPEAKITQKKLGEAFGISFALISSWESQEKPKLPPEERLEPYATFFATERSIAQFPFELIDAASLTEDEEHRRHALLTDLQRLRRDAVTGSEATVQPREAIEDSLIGRGPWYFAEGPVVIACAELPKDLQGPLAEAGDPDQSVLYQYADLGSLVELHGHIRAVNPDLKVRFCKASEVTDHAAAHLILLGGVDWNEATRVLPLVPIRQHSVLDDPRRGYFKVDVGGEEKPFPPEFREGSDLPVQDVGHLLRAPSPLNSKRTITVCNGMFGKGVYGTVRTLTDSDFRDRNAEYLEETFGKSEKFSVLFRVRIVGNKAFTPDWTTPDTVLHTWSEESS